MRYIVLALAALLLTACERQPEPRSYESKSQYCQAVQAWLRAEKWWIPYAGNRLDALETAHFSGCWHWTNSIWHEEDPT